MASLLVDAQRQQLERPGRVARDDSQGDEPVPARGLEIELARIGTRDAEPDRDGQGTRDAGREAPRPPCA